MFKQNFNRVFAQNESYQLLGVNVSPSLHLILNNYDRTIHAGKGQDRHRDYRHHTRLYNHNSLQLKLNFFSVANPNRLYCAYCGMLDASTLDHYVPKAYAQGFSLLIKNLNRACSDCNGKRIRRYSPHRRDVHPQMDLGNHEAAIRIVVNDLVIRANVTVAIIEIIKRPGVLDHEPHVVTNAMTQGGRQAAISDRLPSEYQAVFSRMYDIRNRSDVDILTLIQRWKQEYLQLGFMYLYLVSESLEDLTVIARYKLLNP